MQPTEKIYTSDSPVVKRIARQLFRFHGTEELALYQDKFCTWQVARLSEVKKAGVFSYDGGAYGVFSYGGWEAINVEARIASILNIIN